MAIRRCSSAYVGPEIGGVWRGRKLGKARSGHRGFGPGMRVPQPRKRVRLATGRAGFGVRRPSVRRPGFGLAAWPKFAGPPSPGPDQARLGRGSGLSLAAPLPAVRVGVTASPPTTGDRASLASSRFAKVRDRPSARVSSAQGARAMGGVSQGTAFACPEPRRFHEASGSVVSVASSRMSRSGLPDAPFFRFIGGI